MNDKKQWLNDIKKSTQKKKSNDVSFEIFKKNKLVVSESPLINLCNIEYYTELGSHKRIFSAPIVFIKRVVRKSLKFLVFPAFQKQTCFNYETEKYIRILISENIRFQRKIEKLEEDIRKK